MKKVKEWIKENGVSDADIMIALGLTSINQYRNRMNGTTPLTPLERKALAEFTGIPEEELYEKGS